MRRTILSILLLLATVAATRAIECDLAAVNSAPDTIATTVAETSYRKGSSPFSPLDDRKDFIKHIRDSINAIPWDTTRDDNYWRRAIVNSEWGFFTDPTAKKPGFLNLAYKIYKFYSRAFNDYDTAYVVGIPKDWKFTLINNMWTDTYGGIIADKEMKVFMNSNIYSSVGAHLSYMGIGYTYMFDLDNVFGGDPTRHSKWEMSFATSRFSFEAYRSRNSGTVTITRFGDYNNRRFFRKKFDGLTRESSGFDLYYFFNHSKYSQSAAYSYSKIQKRSAGSLIVGFKMATYNVNIDFMALPDDMRDYLPEDEVDVNYKYHYRSYSFMVGYAYNWVFHRNWLFNITMAPSIGWYHSFEDSLDGIRNMPTLNIRGRMGLVRNMKNFFFGMQLIFDASLYHSKDHNFVNSQEDLTIVAGFRF